MNPWLIVLWATAIIVALIILALGALAIYGVYSSIMQERLKLQRLRQNPFQAAPTLRSVPRERHNRSTDK
jgi:uncharacterized membrane protein YcjF (UPF0283 family)